MCVFGATLHVVRVIVEYLIAATKLIETITVVLLSDILVMFQYLF